MANAHGDFIWYELLTTDADAARTFYADVIGWTATDSGQPAIDYRILAAAEGNVGGLMQITDDMPSAGARPVWLGYIARGRTTARRRLAHDDFARTTTPLITSRDRACGAVHGDHCLPVRRNPAAGAECEASGGMRGVITDDGHC